MSDDTPDDGRSGDGIGRAEDSLTDSETGWSRPLVALLARSIRAAHGRGSNSWSIHNRQSGPEVMHGFINIGTVNPDNAWLLIDIDAIPESAIPQIERFIDLKRYNADDTRSFRMLNIPRDSIEDVLELASEAHVAAAGKRNPGKSPHWEKHQDEIRREFERIAGTTIPQPSYIEELRGLELQTSSTATAAASLLFEGVDTELLLHLARDIRNAHSANPNAWAFYQITTGGVILVVEAITTAYVSKSGGGWILHGSSSDPRFSPLSERKLKENYRYYPGFWVEAASRDDLLHIADTYQSEHVAAIRHLANLVKTRTQHAT